MKNYKSVADALDDLKKRGYEAGFSTDTICLYCGDLDIRLNPEEFKVDEEYRFEGHPEHDEDAVVIAITTYAGVKGILIDAYGSYIENASFKKAKQLKSYPELLTT